MSYCPNCGRQILDESMGCPVCHVRNNTTGAFIEGQAEEIKTEESKAEKVEEFTVEEESGKTYHFESNEETGEAEYTKKTAPASEAKIHPVLKIIVIVLIVMVGGVGAVAGCVAGAVLMKSPAEDYRSFGKLLLIVSVVMLAFSLLCCVFSTFLGSTTHYMINYA
ncbi:MAG: hypothetical protein Q4C06_02600 [Bacillota bacterium]|nr:hypothetical protein [Bacillota bacterium]